MGQYAITIEPVEESQEFDVTLRGPGIDPAGQHYFFCSLERCAIFEEAVNFA